MKKLFTLSFASILFFSMTTVSFAHVANEKTLYEDLEFTEAKDEIALLRGIDAIAYEEGVSLYKPLDKLTKSDLAFWAGTFYGLGVEGAEKVDIQSKAVENGLVDSLDGNATYDDVLNAYFDAKNITANFEEDVKSTDELTKEEFALFMNQFLTSKVDGKTLYDMTGYKQGPSGVIEKVIITEEKHEGSDEKTKAFTFVLNSKEYKVSAHPKVLHGPVDLAIWEGKKIEESWLASGHGDEEVLQIIKLEKNQFSEDEPEKTENTNSKNNNNENHKENNNVNKNNNNEEQKENNTSTEEKSLPIVPIIGGVVLILVLGWLFVSKKDK